MNAYDYFGNELQVGDWVALSMQSTTSLTYGKITIINKLQDDKINVGVEMECYNQKYRKYHTAVRYRRDFNVIKMSKELAIEKKLLEE